MASTEYQAGDVLEVQIIGAWYQTEVIHQRHFTLLAGPALGIQIAAILNQDWVGSLRPCYAVDYIWMQYKIRRLDPEPVTAYETLPANFQRGQMSGGTFPYQVASLWALEADTQPNIRKGRIYHPAVSGVAWQEGHWTTTMTTATQNSIGLLMARMGNTGTSALRFGIARYSQQGDFQNIRHVHTIKWRQQPAVIRSRRPDF